MITKEAKIFSDEIKTTDKCTFQGLQFVSHKNFYT
jgi:hypothetical protein